MAVRICTRCNESKDISLFPKQRTYCKKCWQQQGRSSRTKWNKAHAERCREYVRNYRFKNPEKVKEQKKEYLLANQEKVNAYNRAYRRKSPEVKQAHDAVKYALRKGKIKREPCIICGSEAHAHHPSYARDMRLAVTWLCTSHHNQLHNEIR